MTINLGSNIIQVNLEDEMRKSYLDYAMSVIVSRAIPDVCDGLKPVHRRILYAMKESGYDYNKPYRKSARIVGDVMGKYHPHGDSAIYDTLVRMAQNFSMSATLIDGQGNFGSMDGDSAAASRYTEARLSHIAHYLLEDIDKDTVNFQPNYDNSTEEPHVLPARFPNLLVNGAGGIAVGMATNIPPHNLGEVLDACCAYIKNPSITIDELIEIVPAPDFPTGAQIIGRVGARDAYKTGRGSVVMRAKTHFEEVGNREAIIVTEVPYQVNKSKLLERIAELVNSKTIEGIADLRDESDRRGVRVVIEVKRDGDASVILNQLHKHTSLQTSFGCNMLALNGGRPMTMTLKDIIGAFVNFRENVITRRTRYELKKARDKAHVYLGLAVSVANIDDIIKLIRKASSPLIAKEELMAQKWPADSVVALIKMVDDIDAEDATYQLTEVQAKAILDLKLHRLTGLERDKIAEDLQVIVDSIKEYLRILCNRPYLLELLVGELAEVKEKFAIPRRTEISDAELTTDIEDLIQQEDMVVTVTHNGYIKRVPLATYRAQRRGGKGRSGMNTRDEDFVQTLFVANTHTPILFFTSKGFVHNMKVYRLPMGSAQSIGKAMINVLPLDKGETITAIMPMPEDENTWADLQIMFATDRGNVRRNNLSDFVNIRSNGKIAMKLDDAENLIGVATCDDDTDVLLTASNGKCVRFSVTDVRIFASRNSTGVRGIRITDKDRVISMSTLKHSVFTMEERDLYLRLSRSARASETLEFDDGLSETRYREMAENEEFLLSVSEKGFGKRTSAYEYRLSNRGTQGMANMEISSKTGKLVTCFPIKEDDEIMMVSNSGQLIRSPINEVRIAGRKTQGVTLFRVKDKERVVSVECIGDMGSNDDDGEDISHEDAPESGLPN